MKKGRGAGHAMSMPGGLALGGCVSLGTTVLGSAVLAKLVEAEIMAQSSIGYGVMVLLITAAFLSSAVSAGRIKRRTVLVCAASALIYMGQLLGITALFFGGQYRAVGVTALLVLCGSSLALLAAMPRGKKRGGRIPGAYSR